MSARITCQLIVLHTNLSDDRLFRPLANNAPSERLNGSEGTADASIKRELSWQKKGGR